MKKIPISKPFVNKEDKNAVLQVLNSGHLSLGNKYLEFEKKFATYNKNKYACTVTNGTCGLHLAIKSLNIGINDEVITTPFSFISSANCIIYEKAKPIFVDIEENSYNIDPNKIEAVITKKTKAILVVHVFGQSADMHPIIKIAKKYKLAIIEDACESIGAKYYGKNTGTFGDIGVFAFYPNKQMTTGEGGIIVSDNKKLLNLCKSIRNQGRDENNQWLVHKRLGYNYRMSDIHAALGISQLKKLKWFIKERIRIASTYNKLLANIPDIIPPKILENRTHSYFVYVIRVLKNKRNYLMQKLTKLGIQTRPYFPVIHLQPYFKKVYGYKIGDYPIAEKIAGETLALPIYVDLTNNEIKYITKEIKQILYA